MTPQVLARYILGLGIGLFLLAIPGCSDNTNPPQFAITGVVVDSEGAPVPAAHIGLSYEWVSHSISAKLPSPASGDGTALSMMIVFTLAQTSNVTLAVQNYRGETVRVLMDQEDKDPGQYTITWDGKNSAGQQVPDGLYRAHLVTDEFTNDTPLLVGTMCEGMTAADAYLVVTDAEGRFSIDMDWIPFDETLPETNEQGDVIGQTVFAGGVDVCAWKDTRSGTKAVKASRTATRTLEVVID